MRRFCFRLALALGFPHPDHLLRLITARQLAEWEAYYQIEPWGYHAEHYRAGVVAATVANFSPCSRRHDLTPADFTPEERRPKTLADKVRATFGIPRRKR